MSGAMRGELRRLLRSAVIAVIAIAHGHDYCRCCHPYGSVGLRAHDFDFEALHQVDLWRLEVRPEDCASPRACPASLDLARSYYCTESDSPLVSNLSRLVAGSSSCSMMSAAVRPRIQLATASSSTWVSFLVSHASVAPTVAIAGFANSYTIRNSIARKDSVTLSITSLVAVATYLRRLFVVGKAKWASLRQR